MQAPAQPKYEIKGKPLIDFNIFQLGNDPSDPMVLELTQEVVRTTNEDFRGNQYVELDLPDLRKGQMLGHSNPYRRWAWGPRARKLYGKDSKGNEIGLLTPGLLELALEYGTLPDGRNTYEDLAVVVYSTTRANSQLAQHLVDQAKRIGQVKFPVVIYGLQTVKDDRFPDGLRFDLGDVAVAYHVPILSRTGKFDASDPELAKTGFPSKLGSGSRTLYIADYGLRRVFRNRYPILDASNAYLSYSSEAGRVSFVKGAAPQNLEAALQAVEAEVGRQEEAISARKARALEILGQH